MECDLAALGVSAAMKLGRSTIVAYLPDRVAMCEKVRQF
jgi:hypothetical protein